MRWNALIVDLAIVLASCLVLFGWGRGRLRTLRKLSDLAVVSFTSAIVLAIVVGWFGRGWLMWSLLLWDASALILAAGSLGWLSGPKERLWRINKEAQATYCALTADPEDTP